MANQSKKVVRPASRESAGNFFLVGVICLAAGLGIGYYFGKGAGTAPTTVAPPAQQQVSIMDPAAFLREEASLKAVLSSSPTDLNTLVKLGNLYYDNGKFADAVDWYGKALEIDPDNVSVRTDKGTSLWNLGQADAAIAEFQKSLAVNPSHPQTLYNLGIVYLHGKDDMAGARSAWEKLLATNPDYPESARLQQMLNSLAESAPAQDPLAAPPAQNPEKPAPKGIEDLFKRMKK